MAEQTFDQERATRTNRELIAEAQRIRDLLSKEVIDYYWEAPTSEAEEREYHDGMRKFLRQAVERIDDLLRRLA